MCKAATSEYFSTRPSESQPESSGGKRQKREKEETPGRQLPDVFTEEDSPSKQQLELLLLLLSSSLSPLCRVFIHIFLRQTMSLRNTMLQPFCRSCVWCPYH
jgi:hypothetical protein